MSDKGYWEVLEAPIRALVEAAALLTEHVPGPLDRAPMSTTLRASALGLGLIILGRERPEGGSIEVTAGPEAIHVWGSEPGEKARRVLTLLGWHEHEEGGEKHWRCWP